MSLGYKNQSVCFIIAKLNTSKFHEMLTGDTKRPESKTCSAGTPWVTIFACLRSFNSETAKSIREFSLFSLW